jgi:outer membrane protein
MKKIFLLFLLTTFNAHGTNLIELYDRALQHNIDLSQKSLDIDIANEVLEQTQSSVFPDINFTARASETTIERYKSSGSYNPSNFDRDTYNLSIKQPLFHLYVFDEIKKSKSVLQENKIRQNDSESVIILESIRHYFNLIKHKNLLLLNQLKKELNYVRYQNSKTLLESGNITIQDYENYKNDFSRSKIDVDISQNNLIETKNQVYMFSGKELNDINDIKLINLDHETFNTNEIILEANLNNSSIKLAKQNIKKSRHDIASQKSRHYPTIDLIAEYDYVDITQGGSQFGATTREDSSISLVLNFPIYNGGFQTSKTREARLNYQKARLDYSASKRSIRNDLIDTLNDFNTNKKLYDLSRDLIESYLKSYESAQLGYEKGIYTDTQLLEIKIKYHTSVNDSKNIMMDYLFSKMKLYYLQNKISLSELRKINTYLIW